MNPPPLQVPFDLKTPAWRQWFQDLWTATNGHTQDLSALEQSVRDAETLAAMAGAAGPGEKGDTGPQGPQGLKGNVPVFLLTKRQSFRNLIRSRSSLLGKKGIFG